VPGIVERAYVKETETSWLKVAVLISAGAAVALQIGKVPAALPALQAELGLTLVQSSWVVAIFSTIAAGFAVFLGTISDRFGQLQVAIFGMLLTAASGIAGGFVSNGNVLLLTRVFEGLGFILTSASMPSLIMLAVSEVNRKASLALWGMYMPMGSGIMLALSGPILFYYDWRVLWWITACLILLVAIPVYIVGARVSANPGEQIPRPAIRQTLKYAMRRGPILLSVIFAVYAALYLIVAGFLPLILIELNGFTPLSAALVSAAVIFFNVLGNGVSGWLHGLKFHFRTLILTGCLGMAVCGAIVFSNDVAGPWRVIAAAGFCGFAGLVPSSLFSELPNHAPHPSVMATISGLLVQGAAVGQLAGPPLAASFVAWYGDWSAAVPIMVVGAAIGAACTLYLSRLSDGKHRQESA
jgi:MFS family permease